MADRHNAATDTLAWLEAAVIGLNLCPFAAPASKAGRIDIVVSDADQPDRLIADLDHELSRLTLQSAGQVETLLLVVVDLLNDFDEFNDFLDVADALLAARGLVGTIQIASFHPDYRFDGVAADDPGNWTNRSPWPTLHLLREDSISRAAQGSVDVTAIPARNQRVLAALSEQQRRQVFGRA